MLSYRHIYHAGNHADVFKHTVLVALLEHLTAKAAPLRYIETHAGAGGYGLTTREARQHREYESGIGRIWSAPDAPGCLDRLLALVRDYNSDATALTAYPGSPWIARACLRPDDSLFLHELHPRDADVLRAACRGDRRVHVRHEDGLTACIGLVPPPERRGLVFIDPSYEVKTEYRAVADALCKAHRRFATGVYAIWYPIIGRRGGGPLVHALRAAGIAPVQRFELSVEAAHSGYGLTGSGMLVINPPWRLVDTLRAPLQYLAERFSTDGRTHFRINAEK